MIIVLYLGCIKLVFKMSKQRFLRTALEGIICGEGEEKEPKPVVVK